MDDQGGGWVNVSSGTAHLGSPGQWAVKWLSLLLQVASGLTAILQMHLG